MIVSRSGRTGFFWYLLCLWKSCCLIGHRYGSEQKYCHSQSSTFHNTAFLFSAPFLSQSCMLDPTFIVFSFSLNKVTANTDLRNILSNPFRTSSSLHRKNRNCQASRLLRRKFNCPPKPPHSRLADLNRVVVEKERSKIEFEPNTLIWYFK